MATTRTITTLLDKNIKEMDYLTCLQIHRRFQRFPVQLIIARKNWFARKLCQTSKLLKRPQLRHQLTSRSRSFIHHPANEYLKNTFGNSHSNDIGKGVEVLSLTPSFMDIPEKERNGKIAIIQLHY